MTSPRPVPTQGILAPYDLAERQLAALAAWHERRRMQQAAAEVGQRSREQRLDLARRMDVLREQHRAIVARTDAQLQASVQALSSTRPKVLVVHRNTWFADKLGSALTGYGADVMTPLGNGAQAVGVALVEQPELLLVEETLPMLSGEDVVREVLCYSPRTVVVAQVAHDGGAAGMLSAGASAAYPRRVPPGEVAAGMFGLWERSSP